MNDTGLIYYGARYYDPSLGLFVSRDPMKQFFSPYRYGPGDPLNYVDPSGMNAENADETQDELGGGGGASAGAGGGSSIGSGGLPYGGSETVEVTASPLDAGNLDVAGAGMAMASPAGVRLGIAIGRAAAGFALDVAGFALGVATGLLTIGLVVLTASEADAPTDEPIREGDAGDGNRGPGGKNDPRSTLPRDKAGNYLPDPKAQGAHTVVGERTGRSGSYSQGATFDSEGNFEGRTDVTNHGRSDHTNPHFHPATGPNSVGAHRPIR